MSKLINSRSYVFRPTVSLLIPEVKEGVGGTKSRNTPTKVERNGQAPVALDFFFPQTWRLSISEAEEGVGGTKSRNTPTKSERSEQAHQVSVSLLSGGTRGA